MNTYTYTMYVHSKILERILLTIIITYYSKEVLQVDSDQEDYETGQTESKLNLLKILQHFSVYTGHQHKDMTF